MAAIINTLINHGERRCTCYTDINKYAVTLHICTEFPPSQHTIEKDKIVPVTRIISYTFYYQTACSLIFIISVYDLYAELALVCNLSDSSN